MHRPIGRFILIAITTISEKHQRAFVNDVSTVTQMKPFLYGDSKLMLVNDNMSIDLVE